MAQTLWDITKGPFIKWYVITRFHCTASFTPDTAERQLLGPHKRLPLQHQECPYPNKDSLLHTVIFKLDTHHSKCYCSNEAPQGRATTPKFLVHSWFRGLRKVGMVHPYITSLCRLSLHVTVYLPRHILCLDIHYHFGNDEAMRGFQHIWHTIQISLSEK